MDFNFASIPAIYFGTGKLKLLPDLLRKYGSRVLLLTGGSSLADSGFLHKLTNDFHGADLKTYHISCSCEPSTSFVDDITSRAREDKIDVVVSVGGGSVVDTGKAISAMITQHKPVKDFLEGVGTGEIHNGRKIPFVAVPTTSGTGSEATKNAVISKVGKHGFKKSLRHENFIPDIAIIDPRLSLSCPPAITAYTGLDAVTQLLESYVSTIANPVTDALAWSGLEKAAAALPVVYKNGTDLNARSNMSYAAFISGITLANAGLGIVHGFAGSIGGFYNIPHGVVCGTLFAEAIKNNILQLEESAQQSAALLKYARTGYLFAKRPFKDVKEGTGLLSAIAEEWVDKMNIPKLGEFGINEDDLDRIVIASGQKNNPVKLNTETLLSILKNRL